MKINDKGLVKEARVKLGLTQEQLADKLGITRQQIINLEKGHRQVMKQTELAIECLLLQANLM